MNCKYIAAKQMPSRSFTDKSDWFDSGVGALQRLKVLPLARIPCDENHGHVSYHPNSWQTLIHSSRKWSKYADYDEIETPCHTTLGSVDGESHGDFDRVTFGGRNKFVHMSADILMKKMLYRTTAGVRFLQTCLTRTFHKSKREEAD